MNSTPQENSDSSAPQSNDSSSPREKSRPGLWLWGSMGCLVFVIIGLVAFSLTVKKVVQNDLADTHHIPTVPGTSAMVNITNIGDAIRKMKAIDKGVVAYRHDKGTYPDNLEQLIPAYLPGKANLHALVDTNPDPNHDSFIYRKPTDSAPMFTLFLGVSDTYVMSAGPASQQITTLIQMSLDGQVQQENTAVANPVSNDLPVPGAASPN